MTVLIQASVVGFSHVLFLISQKNASTKWRIWKFNRVPKKLETLNFRFFSLFLAFIWKVKEKKAFFFYKTCFDKHGPYPAVPNGVARLH